MIQRNSFLFRFRRAQVHAFHGKTYREIVVTEGTAWLTSNSHRDDIFLNPGEKYALSRGETIYIETARAHQSLELRASTDTRTVPVLNSLKFWSRAPC